MTNEEQADYNKAFTEAFQMHVCGIDEEDIKLFIEDSHKYSDEISEGYTALADANGMFWNGYELGLKHAKEKNAQIFDLLNSALKLLYEERQDLDSHLLNIEEAGGFIAEAMDLIDIRRKYESISMD